MQSAHISNSAAPCRHIDEKKNAKRERALSLWSPCSCRCRQRFGRPRFAAKVTLLSPWVGRLQLDNAAHIAELAHGDAFGIRYGNAQREAAKRVVETEFFFGYPLEKDANNERLGIAADAKVVSR